MARDVCVVDKLIEASATQKRLLDIPEYKCHWPRKRVNGTSPPQHVTRYVPLGEGESTCTFCRLQTFPGFVFLAALS